MISDISVDIQKHTKTIPDRSGYRRQDSPMFYVLLLYCRIIYAWNIISIICRHIFRRAAPLLHQKETLRRSSLITHELTFDFKTFNHVYFCHLERVISLYVHIVVGGSRAMGQTDVNSSLSCKRKLVNVVSHTPLGISCPVHFHAYILSSFIQQE